MILWNHPILSKIKNNTDSLKKIIIKNRLQSNKLSNHLLNNSIRILLMTEQFLDLVRNCSKDSKLRVSSFLSEIFNDQTETNTQQSQSENNHLNKIQQLFNKISQKFSIERSRQISKDQRFKKMLTNHEYNYGEITFKTIFKIIKKLGKYRKLSENQIFYDLGSGSGKVIFGAGLCYPFKRCKGIQFLESLYQESLKLKQKIQSNKIIIEQNVNQYASEQQIIQYSLPLIEFLNSDFKTEDWSDATVVYVSSTCYSREVMNEISHLSQRLEKGTLLITLTKSLNNQDWKVVEKFEGETSWGMCTIYIHRKDKKSIKNYKQEQKI